MNDSIKISVITVTLNRAETIRDSIDSVLRQDYKNFEVVVFDGGSTDGTLEILKSYGDKIKWRSKRDNGTSQAMNRACQEASGDVFLFLNSDDYLATNTIFTEVAEHFRNNPGTDILCADLQMVDEGSGLPIKRIKSVPGPQTRWITIQFAGSFSRRRLWEEKNFDETMFIANDHEAICYWIHRLNAVVSYRPAVHIVFRLGGISNVPHKAQLVARERLRIRKAYGSAVAAYAIFYATSVMNFLRLLHFRPFYWFRSLRLLVSRILQNFRVNA